MKIQHMITLAAIIVSTLLAGCTAPAGAYRQNSNGKTIIRRAPPACIDQSYEPASPREVRTVIRVQPPVRRYVYVYDAPRQTQCTQRYVQYRPLYFPQQQPYNPCPRPQYRTYQQQYCPRPQYCPPNQLYGQHRQSAGISLGFDQRGLMIRMY
jgi:hypothetical protein